MLYVRTFVVCEMKDLMSENSDDAAPPCWDVKIRFSKNKKDELYGRIEIDLNMYRNLSTVEDRDMNYAEVNTVYLRCRRKQ